MLGDQLSDGNASEHFVEGAKVEFRVDAIGGLEGFFGHAVSFLEQDMRALSHQHYTRKEVARSGEISMPADFAADSEVCSFSARPIVGNVAFRIGRGEREKIGEFAVSCKNNKSDKMLIFTSAEEQIGLP